MAESSHHVQFPEGVKVEERPKPKQQPTQKYDRKEIQKRLDIESWMEEKLADLFQVREIYMYPLAVILGERLYVEGKWCISKLHWIAIHVVSVINLLVNF